MSYLKFSPDLFLGSQELNRFQRFLREDGYVKFLLENALSFGIVHKDIDDGDWNYFRVEQGANQGDIKINSGVGVDSSGRFIVLPDVGYTLENNNQFYWIKIAHQYDSREEGTVSISRDGTLNGANTSFLSSLRGIPNNPVKVRFSGASTNIYEYEVVEVINDTQAVLAGNFTDESELRLIVAGAFTPDVVPPSGDKEPYQYDGCQVSFAQEAVLNTAPALNDGEYWIARVKRNGSTITIEDKRSLNIFKTKIDWEITSVAESNNPLIGVEAIKFNNSLSPRHQNIVTVGFAFRSSNWTIDSSVNRVTLIGGGGGKFKSTADFTDGDFDGWRVWTANGKYKIVKQSSISALQINLILDSLDPDDFIDTTQQLIISPNCEEVHIVAKTPVGESDLTEGTFACPTNVGVAGLLLPVYKSGACQYEISYYYKNFKTYSLPTIIPDDISEGYFTEAAFDINGNLTGSNKQTYVNGIITLTESSSSYSNVVGSLISGQAFGVEYIELNTAVTPVIDFAVGTRKEHVVITNDDDLDASDADFGTQYSLTADCYLNLRTDVALKPGNWFIIQFRGDYDRNGFNIRFVQDYVDGLNTGDLLYTLNPTTTTLANNDYENARRDNLRFKVTWDGTRWFVQKLLPSTMFSGSISDNELINKYAIVNALGYPSAIDLDDLGSASGGRISMHLCKGTDSNSPGGDGDTRFLVWTCDNSNHTVPGAIQIALQINGSNLGSFYKRTQSFTPSESWSGWTNINDPTS